MNNMKITELKKIIKQIILEQDDFEKGFMTEMLQRRAGIIK